MPDEEKKIFIDEDWKSQVQREKEEAAALAAQQPAPPADDEPEIDADPLFLQLLSSLVTQALFSLGMIAPKGSPQVSVDIEQAHYLIQTLEMLREKMKNNLTPDEEGELTQAVSELQQAYVVRSQQVQEAALRQGASLKKPQP